MRPAIRLQNGLLIGLFAGLSGGWGSVAAADTATVASDLEAALRQELNREVKDELTRELLQEIKDEVKVELQEEAAFAQPPAGDQAFSDDEWQWEDPEPLEKKPPFSIHGYFRFRYDFFDNLDLGLTHVRTDADGNPVVTGPFAPGYAPPTPLCALNAQPGQACEGEEGVSSLGSANMRVRLAPELLVGEDMAVKVEVDVLDNLVLGSTPDGFPNNPVSPLLAFSQTQIPPSDGINAVFTDSIRVKRAWAEVGTLFGDLSFGRMADEFGMGLFAHAGRGVDHDFGDSVDRIEFAVTLLGHRIAPAFDWAATGPTSAIRFSPLGQPFDRDQRDDVQQYVLTLTRQDDAESFEARRAKHGYAFTYGTRQTLRMQDLDAAAYVRLEDPELQSFGETTVGSDDVRLDNLTDRDATVYAYSYWLKLAIDSLTVEAEYAGVIGSIETVDLRDNPDGSLSMVSDVELNQHAAALSAEYRLLSDSLTLRLLVLGASGDSARGWGALPLGPIRADSSFWEAPQAGPGDDSINNFRVDPSFVVDMILWRQLVGMVTDALVIRPGVQYELAPGVGARIDVVYSRAWKAESTPSGSFTTLGESSTDLGVELDTRLFFESDSGLRFWLEYGVLFPMAGLDREVVVQNSDSPLFEGVDEDDRPIGRLDASVAHSLQVLIGLEF